MQLVDYASSSDEAEAEDGGGLNGTSLAQHRKRSISVGAGPCKRLKKENGAVPAASLKPVEPKALDVRPSKDQPDKTVTSAPVASPADNVPERPPRTVPHIAGNWATYVYFAFRPSAELQDLLDRMMTVIRETVPTAQAVDPLEGGLHVSLSRTIYLKVFQIDRFVQLLGKRMEGRRRFPMRFQKIGHYMNDEQTRSFLGLDVGSGGQQLKLFLKDVDNVIQQFGKQVFYETPLFHASFAWALGDALDTTFIERLKKFYPDLMMEHVVLDCVTCVIGNKVFKWPLVS
ncbi:hypothetical protein DFJ77DRAFT_496174 [Powellomyces hirtus]|nr:hypothetical protein DFJ77DRAFT_496174 [Powellomyces hirtus]